MKTRSKTCYDFNLVQYMIFVVNSWQIDQCYSVNITGYNVRYFLLMFTQVVEIEYNIFQHPLFILLYIT